MKNSTLKFLLAILLPILIATLSIKTVVPMTTSQEFTSSTTEYLDSRRAKVLEITAASSAASAAITLIPGDTGTPIAEKLADISGYSVILLCAILLEKYLAMLMGYVSFGFIVPFACGLFILNYLFVHSPTLKQSILRLCIYAVVLTAAIPASVVISRKIETTFDSTIQETIDNAGAITQEIQQNTTGTEENDSLWKKFISKLEGGVSTVTSKFEGILNDFTEAIAIMLVTSCLIPALVLFFLIWMTKQLPLNFEIAPLSLSTKQ